MVGVTMTAIDFKAPCPISDLFSTKKAHISEVDEVPVEGASVPRERLQFFDHFSVTDRAI